MLLILLIGCVKLVILLFTLLILLSTLLIIFPVFKTTGVIAFTWEGILASGWPFIQLVIAFGKHCPFFNSSHNFSCILLGIVSVANLVLLLIISTGTFLIAALFAATPAAITPNAEFIDANSAILNSPFFPGSPLGPGIPGEPIGPGIPGSPRRPGSPLTPGLPGSPRRPGSPLGPGAMARFKA